MWNRYEEFRAVLPRFRQKPDEARAEMQALIPRDPDGAFALMLYYAASCLNYADTARCKTPKTSFDPVLVDGWKPDVKYTERLGKMGIDFNGRYHGNDDELLLLYREEGIVRKPGPGLRNHLPYFKAWQLEAEALANKIYPSGELAKIMESLQVRALAKGEVKMAIDDLRPNRQSDAFRVKTAARPQSNKDIDLQEWLRSEYDYAATFIVVDGKVQLHPATVAYKDAEGNDYFYHGGMQFTVKTAIAHLTSAIVSRENRRNPAVPDETQTLQSEEDLRLQAELRKMRDFAAFFIVVDGRAKLQKGGNYYNMSGETYFRIGTKKYNAEHSRQVLNKLLETLKETNQKETVTMTKTNSFVNSVKGIFGNVIRMQRGRAAVHATKRIIFSAFPIQWGVLARITGKAKKVEDHPLTDVAIALLAHGAANALLDDPAKREKYLKYTEEMVAASVAHAGFKMVPVEEILDKVLKGAIDSEAVQKVASVLKDEK